MIMVCSDLEKRLDSVWYRLQRIEQERVEGISQIGLDTRCVERLERLVAERHMFQVKPLLRPTSFRQLLSGRTFQRPEWRRPTEVWIKIDKNWGQVVNDSNVRVRIGAETTVIEVNLCEDITT